MASRHRFLIDGRQRTVVLEERDGRVQATIDGGDPVEIDVSGLAVPGVLSILVDGVPARAHVSRRGPAFDVLVAGRHFELVPASSAARKRGVVGGLEDRAGEVTAPLAGVVVSIHVQPGDSVEAGELLAVVEAMKMQNELNAPRAGTITAVRCEAGARVERGALLIEYEPAEQ